MSVNVVRDYGARGDGSTDDSDAFNAALATGKTVTAPDGVYMLGSYPRIAPGQRLVGDGIGQTILKRHPSNTSIMVGVGGSLEHVTVDGNWPAVSATFDLGMGEGGRLERVRWVNGSHGCAELASKVQVVDCELVGAGRPDAGAWYGFWFGQGGLRDVDIFRTKFWGLRINAVFGGADGLRIIECDFENNHCQIVPTGGGQVDIVGDGKNNDISHNRFRRCTGQASAIEVDSVDVIDISFNIIEGQPGSGIVLQSDRVHNATISNNKIFDCGAYGVECQTELDNLIWVNNREGNNRNGNLIRARGLQDRNNANT